MLCEIRGIGRYLGMLIVAEIGDIERFHQHGLVAFEPYRILDQELGQLVESQIVHRSL